MLVTMVNPGFIAMTFASPEPASEPGILAQAEFFLFLAESIEQDNELTTPVDLEEALLPRAGSTPEPAKQHDKPSQEQQP